MFLFYLSMGMTVASNVFYHIFQKQIPNAVNPMLSLVVTYLSAAALCLALLPFYPSGAPLLASMRQLNWASVGLAFAVAGLELGFLLAYRAGWNISLAAAVSNVTVIVLLVPVGLLLFKERLTAVNVVGIAVCIAGLWLINQK